MHDATDPRTGQGMSLSMSAVRTWPCAWAHRPLTSHRSEPTIPKALAKKESGMEAKMARPISAQRVARPLPTHAQWIAPRVCILVA